MYVEIKASVGAIETDNDVGDLLVRQADAINKAEARRRASLTDLEAQRAACVGVQP